MAEIKYIDYQIRQLKQRLCQCKDESRWDVLSQLYFSKRYLSDLEIQQDIILNQWTNSFKVKV